jgi:outer membrane protein TolC
MAPSPIRRQAQQAIWLLALIMLSGCAAYSPYPLVDRDTSSRDVGRIVVDARSMPLPELAAHRFDPSHGLDMDDVAMLAVANNPDIKLLRDDLGIARAQAFAAGLLPDPQLNLENDNPSGSRPGLTHAFIYGITMDVMSLLTRSTKLRAANQETAKIDLGMLWQEWQVVAQARQLFIQVVTQDRLAASLQQLVRIQQLRSDRTAAAVAQGNLTLDIEDAVLLTYHDAQRQAAEAERAANQSRHDLNSLLGLAPDVHLELIDTQENSFAVDDNTLAAALSDLPHRRPDLLALQAGYRSQEASYRAAILGQFPNLTVGFVRARDTSKLYTSGFQISFSLPIFNRNRGNIAIAEATRQRLADEYQQRLNQAYTDIDRMRIDQRSLVAQLAGNRAALERLQQTAAQAQTAFEAHNQALASYADAQNALITKQIDIITIEKTLMQARIAMNALLGGELPAHYQRQLSEETHHAN